MARYLRLGMTQRFVLLVVLCGIAILVPALAYSWQAWNSARSHGLEREGLAPARALLRVVQLTQQHRGLSAVWLGGDESQAGARKARADDVGSALAAFESELGRKGVDAGSALARHWRDSRAAWEALQAEVSRKGLDGGASSARHAVVIAGFLRGLDLVLDHWGLVFDPVAADYYLIVAALQGAPRAIETLGQMRARGANLLSNPDKATPEARAAYSTLANTLEAQVASVGFGLERAAAHGAADAGLAKAMQELSAVGVRGVQYARRHVVEAAALNHPSATFYADMTGIIDAMYVETGRLGERLEASLGERIDVARRDMLLTVAAALALFAAAIGVAVHTGVWLTRSLGSEPDALREAAAAVARGDLAQALPLRPGDGTSVLRAMHDMQRSLARLVGGVRDNAGQVAVASSQIAAGQPGPVLPHRVAGERAAADGSVHGAAAQHHRPWRRKCPSGHPAGAVGQRGGQPRRGLRLLPGRDDAADPGQLAAHRRDHRHHRRHRLPDQHPGAECRGGGGPRRRAGARLRGGGR
jgi:hypothetical protein